MGTGEVCGRLGERGGTTGVRRLGADAEARTP